MKALVAVKQVIDVNVKIRVKADQTGVELTNIKMSINPFDEIAVEEAIRLKEAGKIEQIVVVSIGHARAQETIRHALALGADRGILIQTDEAESDLEPLAVSKLLKYVADQEQPQLLLLGKQAIDDDSNQTGQMLAALMHCGQATFASKLEVESQHVKVTREIDAGLQTLKLSLPAVITTDLRLNEPRYVKIPDIMRARKKPLEIIPLSSTGLDITPRLTILQVSEPAQRPAGIRVDSVDELLDKLRHEAGVL